MKDSLLIMKTNKIELQSAREHALYHVIKLEIDSCKHHSHCSTGYKQFDLF